jgi:hypothetical protein|tara:strand:- start:793 stop:1308 length:516 start_codon:yes stop_codon:yes gene_type:complete
MQFNNNGAPSRQHMGKGVSCNGPTLNVTPFYLGSETHTDSYTRSGNFGIQIGIAAPLDGSISEMCKELARQRIYKEKLDSLLVRAKECAALYDLGYMFDPKSELASLCSGVVSIAAYQKFQAQDDPVALQDASYQSSKQALEAERAALKALMQEVSQQQQQQTKPQPSQQQ